MLLLDELPLAASASRCQPAAVARKEGPQNGRRCVANRLWEQAAHRCHTLTLLQRTHRTQGVAAAVARTAAEGAQHPMQHAWFPSGSALKVNESELRVSLT